MSDANDTSRFSDQIRETKICGCQSSTFFKLINMVLGVVMVLYGVFDFFAIFGALTCVSPVICITFRVYEVMFGILLIISFCDFNFIKENFAFLKNTVGKGLFNIFLASMFLVGNNDEIWGWIMMGAFLLCGIFFITIGCCAKEAYSEEDFKSDEIKSKVAKQGVKTAYENQELLNSA